MCTTAKIIRLFQKAVKKHQSSTKKKTTMIVLKSITTFLLLVTSAHALCDTQCASGNIYDDTTKQCTPCWAGFYHPTGGSSNSMSTTNKCLACPQGFATRDNTVTIDASGTETAVGSASTSCEICPSGRSFSEHEDWRTKADTDTTWFNDFTEKATFLPPPK